MPLIVIGADTPQGEAIVDAASTRGGEIRAFVSDPDKAAQMRSRGIKVAMGDISDASHVGGAAIGAFCAVLISTAAVDARERSFSTDPDATVTSWVEEVLGAKVNRVILVAASPLPRAAAAVHGAPEWAIVDGANLDVSEVASRVISLDRARRLPGEPSSP